MGPSLGTICRLQTPLFMNNGTLFAFVFHKMQRDITSHDKTFLHKVSQQQYVAQIKYGISEMYCKINDNTVKPLNSVYHWISEKVSAIERCPL